MIVKGVQAKVLISFSLLNPSICLNRKLVSISQTFKISVATLVASRVSKFSKIVCVGFLLSRFLDEKKSLLHFSLLKSLSKVELHYVLLK